MPSDTQVIALECKDRGWGYYGILASTDQGIVTDDTWWCSSELQTGWANTNFSRVSNWNPAKGIAFHGEAPWLIVRDIADEAMWIWTNSVSGNAYCRNRGNIVSISMSMSISSL